MGKAAVLTGVQGWGRIGRAIGKMNNPGMSGVEMEGAWRLRIAELDGERNRRWTQMNADAWNQTREPAENTKGECTCRERS
ncbi:MAG: hypothetical protein Q8Q12_03900 [bacterium]|nr:hypothetical protein [bacterium]